jgi:drug/metabolite transporter (DMT)-like permease
VLWILLTLTAAPLQVARNAMQRSLVGDAGPWGATLVRFLCGLPFSIAMLAVVWAMTPDANPSFSQAFWTGALFGAVAQVAATGALLMAMGRSGFAVATLFQQASLPMTALLGWWALGDALSPAAWAGVLAASAGLVVLSWPRKGEARAAVAGALLGLVAAAFYAVAFNGYRQAGQALDPANPLVSAIITLATAQAMQSATLGGLLALTRPQALKAVVGSWRSSLAAGFFGSAASACWFGALALAPAAQVRAVGLVEGPVAALVGRRLFRERLSLRQWLGGAMTTLGVLACVLA